MKRKEEKDAAAGLPGRRKSRIAKLGKRSFFLWIAYQTVKGTLTTVFIWVPLIAWHFSSH